MNFVSITFDDLNAFAFLKALYGSQLHTPNIDRVMAMGTTFDNAFAQVAICNASRTSVLSGLDPAATGVHANFEIWHEFVDPAGTLPALLKDAGYSTSIIGKVFHQSDMPEHVASVVADYIFRAPGDSYEDSTVITTRPSTGGAEAQGDYINVDHAIDIVNAAGSDPFALFLGIFKPHLGWVVPQEYFDLYPLDQIELPFALDGDLSDVPEFMRALVHDDLHADVLAADAWKTALQGYFASISFADAMVGRLLDTLEANGQMDDTAILLWTDHGYHLGDKDNWHKFTLWDEAGRAPFILALPGTGDDGQRVQQVVEMVDIMPTVLDLFDIAPPPGLSGRSLLPFIQDPALIDDGVAVTTMYGSAAIRTNGYRYIRYEDGSTELYDIVADPNEWRNLAGDPAWDAVEAELDARLRSDLSSQGWVWVDADASAAGTDISELFVLASGTSASAGGRGDDTYFISDSQTLVLEEAESGEDTVYTSVSFTLPDHVEHLYFRVPSRNPDMVLIGNGGDNIIVGIHRVEGLDGNDSLRMWGAGLADGGLGDDAVQGSQWHDDLRGGDGADVITASRGDDVLDGGLGDDSLHGGDGADTASYASASTGVSVTLGLVDEQDTLGAGIDRLNCIENLVGSEFADSLTGGDEANVIDGGLGHDWLEGGAGIDTVSFASAIGGIVVNLAQRLQQDTGGAGIDTISGFEGIAGSAFADSLTGDGGANRIDGGSGDDVIDGGEGDDSLLGGDGDDTVSYAGAAGGVTVSLTERGVQATAGAGADTLADIENLVGSGWNDSITGTVSANRLLGGTGEDILEGVAGDDDLEGGDGNDMLLGGGGADRMRGGLGDDVFYVQEEGDVAIEEAEGGHDQVRAFLDHALADSFEELRLYGDARNGTGNTSSNFIAGTGYNDILQGLGGEDRLRGRSGDDELGGGADADLIEGGTGGDRLAGGDGDDRLAGEEGDDITEGGAGADAMDGGIGLDTLSYSTATAGVAISLAVTVAQDTISAGSDTVAGFENLVGSSFADHLTGDAAANLIVAGDGDDMLEGGAGGDTLDGGIGADAMTGGIGDDIYLLDDAGDVVTEASEEGQDEIRTGLAQMVLADNVEGLTGTSGAGQSLAGNALANRITAGDGSDILEGGGGADTLEGGFGADAMAGGFDDDVYFVDDPGDVVTEGVEEGGDEIRTGLAEIILADNVETLTGTSGTDQSLTGNALANSIGGGAGNDRIDGGGGADIMSGGLGDDVYFLDDVADMVLEEDGGGSDEVSTSLVAYTLAHNVEILSGTATGGQALTGNGLANVIRGGAGDDVVDGAGGADAMAGGLGDDIYVIDDSGDVVAESLEGGHDQVRTELGSYALGDNFEALIGLSATGQSLTGNALANVIAAGTGDDRLAGGEGDDMLTGGAGADTASYVSATSSVVIDLSLTTAQQTGGAGMDTLAQIESLAGSSFADALTGSAKANVLDGGAGADKIFGASGDDMLFGGDGDDTLTGGRGIDISAGGLGDDLYRVGNAEDAVVETAGEGYDAVRAMVDHVLADNVEELRLIRDARNGTGNESDNRLFGSAGDDMLAGLDGDDSLRGLDGADNLQGGTGDDIFYGGSGADRGFGDDGSDRLNGETGDDWLEGGGGDDALYGRAGADSLFGGDGNDGLVGGLNTDVLSGGGGADGFLFDIGHSSADRLLSDVIADFNNTEGDRINLKHIDADARDSVDQAFAFIGGAAFTGAAGELRWEAFEGGIYVEGDVNGDALTDFAIRLDAVATISSSDFNL
ncbi:sulfatase-like hydrolase/transferase [Enterovirga sp. GCM10030262]|uniref:sulfatase-like hydrolase/transferase n=1 Tax=Enterovirga sp. GCM10030262 TaxID=3273391 RepID=UPI003623F366